jgi:hypothetical protein
MTQRFVYLNIQGYVVTVNPNRFLKESNVFKSRYPNEQNVNIDVKVAQASADAFRAFINKTNFEITPQNYSDLQLLAAEWDVKNLKRTLDTFIEDQNNAKQVVIPSIISGMEHNRDTSSEERQLSANLFDFVDDPQILTLNLGILERVISRETAKIQERETFPPYLFELVMRLLKAKGVSASLLLTDLSIETLSAEQLRALRDCKEFDWSYVRENVGRDIANWVDDQEQLERNTRNRLEAFNRVMNERLENNEIRIQAFVEKTESELTTFRNEQERLKQQPDELKEQLTKRVDRLYNLLMWGNGVVALTWFVFWLLLFCNK